MSQERTSSDHVWILANPKAGARASVETIDRLATLLESRRFRVRRFGKPDELARALESLDSSIRSLVMAGGDGTANLVAQMAPPTVPLIPLPLGTENLLARYLGYDRSPEQIAAAIEAGRVERFDVGECNGRLFLLMVGCGFDAEVVRRVHGSRRGHIRRLYYAGPILRSILTYPFPTLRVSYRDISDSQQPVRVWEGKWAFIVNLPRYARGLTFAPRASGQDGRLDLCLFRSGSLLRSLYYLRRVVRGDHDRLPDCTVVQTDEIHVEVAEAGSAAEVPWQYDGDPGGVLPIDVRVLPQHVSLIVPAETY